MQLIQQLVNFQALYMAHNDGQDYLDPATFVFELLTSKMVVKLSVTWATLGDNFEISRAFPLLPSVL